jgi:undecaprenyl-diphosphatase
VTLLHLIVVAVVQGITEFLPISSSGHLALVPKVACWPDQGLLIDVAVHIGTLGAVITYLWRDVWFMLTAVTRIGMGLRDPGVRLIVLLAIATVPVLIAGVLVHHYAGDALRDLVVIGWATLGFGLVLYACDRAGRTTGVLDHMTRSSALWIGLAQIAALIPGASRAGVTISAARALGFDRQEAARFSMLLSIPTIIGAGTLAGLDLARSGNATLQADAVIAAALAFVTAYIAIALMMRWLRRASFTPFVVYRIILGAGLLALAYTGAQFCNG